MNAEIKEPLEGTISNFVHPGKPGNSALYREIIAKVEEIPPSQVLPIECGSYEEARDLCRALCQHMKYRNLDYRAHQSRNTLYIQGQGKEG